MINVNNADYCWVDGMTVETLLIRLKENNKFSYLINSTTTVIINRTIVPDHEFAFKLINDEDIIVIFPMLMGG